MSLFKEIQQVMTKYGLTKASEPSVPLTVTAHATGLLEVISKGTTSIMENSQEDTDALALAYNHLGEVGFRKTFICLSQTVITAFELFISAKKIDFPVIYNTFWEEVSSLSEEDDQQYLTLMRETLYKANKVVALYALAVDNDNYEDTLKALNNQAKEFFEHAEKDISPTSVVANALVAVTIDFLVKAHYTLGLCSSKDFKSFCLVDEEVISSDFTKLVGLSSQYCSNAEALTYLGEERFESFQKDVSAICEKYSEDSENDK